jgi:hypothetical protein
MNPSPLRMEGAPILPLPGSLLVYFRADCITKIYPPTAGDIFDFDPKRTCPPVEGQPPLPATRFMVWQSLDEPSESAEFDLCNVSRVWSVMQELFAHLQQFPARRVYSIHAYSTLAVLARWYSCRAGVAVPNVLLRPLLVDIPEAVLAPSILSLQKRNSFDVEEYARILELSPDEGYDRETGLLISLIKLYGQT